MRAELLQLAAELAHPMTCSGGGKVWKILHEKGVAT